MKTYSKYYLRANLAFSNLHLENGELKLDQLTLAREQSPPFFKSDSLSIAFNLLPWNGPLYTHVTFLNPHLQLPENSKEIKKPLKRFLRPSSWLRIHSHITIENGKLSWNEGKNPHELTFKLDADSDDEASMSFIFLNDPKLPAENLSIDIKFDKKGLTLGAAFNQFSAEHIASLFQSMFWGGSPINTSGVLQGHLSAFFPRKKAPMQLYTDLQIADAVFHDSQNGIAGHLPAIHFHFENEVGIAKIVEKGNLSFDVAGKTHQIQDVVGEISLKEWKGQNYQLQATYSCLGSGVEGGVHFSCSDDEMKMKLNMKSKMEKLVPFFPNAIQTGLRNLADEVVAVEAQGRSKKNETFIEGEIGFSDTHRMSFGIETGRTFKGWFKGDKLPLETFVTPFVFPGGEVTISGLAKVEGAFDAEQAIIHYWPEIFKIENSHFSYSQNTEGDLFTDANSAVHTINFQTFSHQGKIPLLNGTYSEKHSGLVFNDLKAVAVIQEKKATIENIETFMNNIYLSGFVDVDYAHIDKGIVDVTVNAHTLHGKIANLKNLLSDYDQHYFFSKLPLEGTISFIKDGGHFHYRSDPALISNGYSIQAHMQGALTEGSFTPPNSDVAIHELNLNIEYDHQAQNLALTDIQGTLLVGKLNQVDEYDFAGEKIHFTDLSKNLMEFDLWIGDKKRDFLRVAGKTIPSTDPSLISFDFDPSLTHFGDVHPRNIALTLKDWTILKTLHIGLDFHLETLFKDLQRFSRTGFFFLSKNLLGELNEVKKAEGEINLDLRYDRSSSQLNFDMIGNNVVVNRHAFKKLVLNGKKQKDLWAIDHLQLDDLAASAEIALIKKKWQINFLGFKYGKSLMMGLEGEFLPEHNRIEANLNLLEIDLGHIHEFPAFTELAEQMQPKGVVKAKGEIQIEFFKQENWWKATADLNAGCKELQIKGIPFETPLNFLCHYVSDQGISIHQFQGSLHSKEQMPQSIHLNVDKIDYLFSDRALSIDQLQFKMPKENLDWMGSLFLKKLPKQWSEVVSQDIFKQEADLEGTLQVSMKEGANEFRVAINQFNFPWKEERYPLNDVVIVKKEKDLHATAFCKRKENPFWIGFRASYPDLNFIEANISEQSAEELTLANKQPLTLQWEPVNQQITLVKVNGQFSGVDAALVFDKEKQALKGPVFFSLSDMKNLLSKNLLSQIEALKINRGYRLDGLWSVDMQKNDVSFQGNLEGNDCEFFGYNWDKMNSQLVFNPEKIEMKNWIIKDFSGTWEVPELVVDKSDPLIWSFSIPTVEGYNVVPSTLKLVDSDKQEQKPFVIQYLLLENISGDPFNQNSYQGKGFFRFTNSFKKNANPILAIPTEVINRIGLDPTLLSPASGSISFEIRNKNIFFTEMKDVYSKAKLSKFYLAPPPAVSYMGFDGNLHLQIKMKQYNILFKLAELFTFSIEGTMQKPIYSFQKVQSDRDIADQ